MESKPTMQPAAYSVAQAARILGVSAKTIRAAVYRGEMGSFRVGRRLLIPRVCVDTMLQTAGKRGEQ